MLNGSAVSSIQAGLGLNDIFTGTLSDGSVFIISPKARDKLDPGTLTLTQSSMPAIDTSPIIVSSGVGPRGLRPDQALTILGGGSLSDLFAAVSSSLDIQGGVVGNGLEVAYSDVQISGGMVGDDFNAYNGSTITITGGSLGNKFEAFRGSQINISDGVIGDLFIAHAGSEINISGGTFGDRFSSNNSTILISDGVFGNDIHFSSGVVANIAGGSFGRGFFCERS